MRAGMEDDRTSLMWLAIPIVLVSLFGSFGHGAICPAACRCQNDILKTVCSSKYLEVVPIQLNPELHILDLSNNKISNIHFSFPFYEKLQILNLSSNKIKTVGNSNFLAQKNLTHLYLSNNQLQNLTKDSLKGLKAVTHLDLSNNSLEEIHLSAFRELHSLSVLKLSNNKLVHLEDGLFRTTKNLKELYLDSNQFLEVPTSALAEIAHLRYLSLSRNLILSIEDQHLPYMSELRTLLLDNNLIIEIEPSSLTNLVTLEHLDVSDNNLTTVPTAALANLTNIKILKLSGNFITSIPSVAFRGLFHLRVLKMDRLEVLEFIGAKTFADNVNLEKIYMDYNVKITKLPTRLFHGNFKLKFISVRFNSLKTLEATHFPLDQLHELRVGGNPLNCNCSLGWLWHLLREYRVQAIRLNETMHQTKNVKASEIADIDLKLDMQEVECTAPKELDGKLLVDATKNQMDCSVGWMAAVSVSVTVIFIAVVIGGIVYWAPKRKSSAVKKDLALEDNLRIAISSGPIHTSKRTDSYEPAHQPVEKYLMPPLPPHLMMHHEYRSLATWDPYGDGTGDGNIYEQLNHRREYRPHIVYV